MKFNCAHPKSIEELVQRRIVKCALAAVNFICFSCPLSTEGHDVAMLRPQSRIFTQGGSRQRWCRSVEGWRCIQPKWMVAVFVEAPLVNVFHKDPKSFGQRRALGAVVIDTQTGLAKIARPASPWVVGSVLPVGIDACGIVLRKDTIDGKSYSHGMSVWNLATDEFEDPRDWDPVFNPVARVVDMSRVSLSWHSNRGVKSATRKLMMDWVESGSRVAIPGPLKDYVSPIEMSSLWEEGSETRWYAPTDNGVGAVVFEGKYESSFKGLPPQSTLTYYDPTSASGVRWRIKLSNVLGDDTRKVEGVLPIVSDSSAHSSVLLEIVSDAKRQLNTMHRVQIVRIQARDGVVRDTLEFDRPKGAIIGWPRGSPDQNQVLYMFDPRDRAFALQVFSITDAAFLNELSIGIRMPALWTVLSTREAVVTDPYRMWAVGVGNDNYGRVRDIVRMFTDDDEAVPVDRDDGE